MKKGWKYTPPLHSKSLSVVEFLGNPTLQNRFFKLLEESEKKLKIGEIRDITRVQFQPIIESINLNRDLISKLRKGVGEKHYPGMGKEFLKKFDSEVEKLKINREKLYMEYISQQMRDQKGTYNQLKRGRDRLWIKLQKKYGFIDKIKQIQRETEGSKYLKMGELFLELVGKGIRINHSLHISGLHWETKERIKKISPKLGERIQNLIKKEKRNGDQIWSEDHLKESLSQQQKLISLNGFLRDEILLKRLNESLLDENNYLIKLNQRVNERDRKELKKLKLKEKRRTKVEYRKNFRDGYITKSYFEKLFKENNKKLINGLLNHLKNNIEFNKNNQINISKTFENFKFENHRIRPFHISPTLKKYPKILIEYKKIEDDLILKFRKKKNKEFLNFFKEQIKNGKVYTVKQIIKEIGISYLEYKLLKEEYHDEIMEFRKRISEEKWNTWISESKKRTLQYIDKGFHYNDSLFMGGLGESVTRISSIRVIGGDKIFQKQFVDRVKRYKKTIDTLPISEKKLKFKKEYLNKLKEFKKLNDRENKLVFKGLDDDHFKNNYWVSPKNFFHSSIVPPDYPFYLRRVLLVIIRSHEKRVKKFEEKLKEKEKFNSSLLRTLPQKSRKMVGSISRNGVVFYDVNQKEIFRTCTNCQETKPINYFPIRSRGGHRHCIECHNIKLYGTKEKQFKSDWRNGVLIKKRNSQNEITHIRCNSCSEFKLTNKFRHRYKGSRVCVDCYVDLPNNVLTKPFEFKTITKGKDKGKRVRMRVYDDVTYQVVKKRCRICEELQPIEYFSLSNSSPVDGRSYTCKTCRIGNKKSDGRYEFMKSRKTGLVTQVRWYDPKTNILQKKLCTNCDKVKKVSEFTQNFSNFDNISIYCRECHRMRRKQKN